MAKPLTGKVARSLAAREALARRRQALSQTTAPTWPSATWPRLTKLRRSFENLRARVPASAAFRADQADPAQVEGLIKMVVERFGHLDILVNNAGVFAGSTVDNPENNLAELDRQFAVNVGGMVAAIRAASRVMGEGGRIISVSSCMATHVGFPGFADYAETKAGIIGYTKGAARTWPPGKLPSMWYSQAPSAPKWPPPAAPSQISSMRLQPSVAMGGPRRSRRRSLFSPVRVRRISPERCWRSMGAMAPDQTIQSIQREPFD